MAYIYYHDEKQLANPPPLKKSPMQLKGDSANGMICFYDRILTGTTQSTWESYVIKVQMNVDKDPIINDSVMNLYLAMLLGTPQLERFKDHFMSIHGSFVSSRICYAKYDVRNNFNEKVVENNTFCYNLLDNTIQGLQIQKSKPCIVLSKFAQNVPLYEISPLDLVTRLSWRLCEFFQALMHMGNTTGFAHHDMHTGNVLFDSLKQRFVLIDYGRSHIPLHPNHKNIIDSIVTREKNKFASLNIEKFQRYHIDSKDVPWRIIKTIDGFQGMYILNDIGGLCRTLILQIKEEQDGQDLFHYLIKNISALQNSIMTSNDVTKTCNEWFIKMRIEADGLKGFAVFHWFFLLATCVGIIWTNTLEVVASGHRLTPFREDHHYCLITPVVFEKVKAEMQGLYTTKVFPLVTAWLKYIESHQVNQKGGSRRSAFQLGGVSDMSTLSHGKSFKETLDKRMEMIQKMRENEDAWLTDDVLNNLAKRDMNDKRKFKLYLQDEENTLIPNDKLSYVVQKKERALDPNSTFVTAYSETKPVAGGNLSKPYKIAVERNTKRKYIVKSRAKWYLDENRGKYIYADAEKKHVVLRNVMLKRA